MERQRKVRRRRALDMLFRCLLLAVLVMIPVCGYEGYKYYRAWQDYENTPEMSEIPATQELEILEGDPEVWPDSSLFVERNRAEFKSGDLRLVIPRMGVEDEVMDGTDRSALKKGPGLYTVAQMPSIDPQVRANTSIAAHRAGYGRYGNLFREIETLKDGDLCYLQDRQWIYVYRYGKTRITVPEDISVLYLQDVPSLTLTSCHPLGENSQRIVVTCPQMGAFPVTEDFPYPVTEEELEAWLEMAEPAP